MRMTTKAFDRPPSLRPSDFGNTTLPERPGRLHKRRGSSRHGKPLSISAPSSFRRLDYTDGQRAGLIPLRLGPVVLKDAPTPYTTAAATVTPGKPHGTSFEPSDSTEGLLDEAHDPSYRASRGSPYQRCQQRGSDLQISSPERQSSPAPMATCSPTTPGLDRQRIGRPPISTQSSSASLRRQALETNTLIGAQRSSSERTRLQRKRSLPNVRRPYVESGEMEMDQEILELNTIVEERRAEALRLSGSKQHVAAIAPTMQMHARSETLRDIGSGLARPFTARDISQTSQTFVLSEKPSRPSTARVSSHSSSRVSGWLSGLVSSASAPSQAQTPQQEPFYKCLPTLRPRAQSETSMCSSVTALDSPSLTTASSPTSKAHSRSLTAESRITPLSPMPTIYSHDYADLKEVEEPWPMVATVTRSQVGLAL